MIKKILTRVIAVILLLWVGLFMLNFMSKPASELGVRDGLLAACPDSPNCVSTRANDKGHAIDAIAFEGPSEEAMKRIESTLGKMPRTKIVTREENYIHATATTLLLRYVDDVEFTFDAENQQIHFRSASRIGYSDMGANRARMERFRELFAAQ
ncbi:MAG: DUF1499 domain-containing protein [Planctomycetota bacterium]